MTSAFRRATAVLAVGAALAATGCSSGSSTSAAEVPVPAGVSVSVLQYRSDQSVGRIQIKVRNDGKAPITVSGASLTAAGFAGTSAWTSRGGTDDATIGPGEATDLPAPLPGEVICTASPAPGATPTPSSTAEPAPVAARARISLRQGEGGAARTKPVAVEDPYDALGIVHDRDCREKALGRVTRVDLVDPLRTDGGKTYLDLRFTPTGRPGTVTVESVRSTTLLDPPNHVSWPIGATITAGRPRTVSLELHPARCDPHAVAEDKRGTVVSMTLRVNDDAAGEVTFPANPKLRTEIQNWVLKSCGF